MAANIETRNGKVMMFYVDPTTTGDGVPWHGTGTRVTEAQTSEQALVLSGQDCEYELGQIWGGPDREHLTLMEDRRAVIRTLDGAILGDVGAEYKIIANRRQYRFMDGLKKDGILEYDTAGSLRGGRRIFMSARLGEEQQIVGESHQDYLFATSTHDGTGAFQVFITRIRAVCDNTVRMILQGGGNEKVRVVHQGDIEAQFAAASDKLQIVTAAQARLTAWQQSLAAVTVDAPRLTAVDTALFPAAPAQETKALDDLQRQKREAAIATFRAIYDAEKDLNGPTGYSLLQGVTGYADHIVKVRDGKNGEGRVLSMLSGKNAEFKRAGLSIVADVTGIPLPV